MTTPTAKHPQKPRALQSKWVTSNLESSKEIIALMGILSALLAITRYHVQDSSSITDMSLFFLLKLCSLVLGPCILRLHHSLQTSCKSAFRRRTDDCELASLLAVCVLVIYQQGGIGLSFFSYRAEVCFWLGYWFEWWTGAFSLLLYMSGCTSDNNVFHLEGPP